jgi:Sigma-70, region 4
MTRLDDLPPDQRAVLLLLVQQGKSHAEIAELLGIPERAVRDRAHAGLEALAAGPDQTPRPGPPRPVSPPSTRSGDSATTPQQPPQSPLRGPRTPASASRPGASRRAGALLLGAIVVVIVVVVVLVTSGGGGSNSASSTSSTSAAGQPHVDKQLNLAAAEPGSSAVGIAEVLSQGSQYAFFVAAEHLPATTGFFYAAWLYNSPTDARVLGRAPAVTSNGRLQAVGALPANAAHYRQLLITRETTTKPSHPGPIVLSGPFSLH